ncbi:hypothetical protein LEN26_018831 [Aphanomyces euteiches]|nr:hypothetical protein LEN26_018831 [Aphanomyces euteiches]KAH9104974.1 hypothetical protein AeMF1_019097 [Aphanomyces euteiches]KAH9194171.1 hypothetical protein AeNC1_003848 [Aphanomyces euteiches]
MQHKSASSGILLYETTASTFRTPSGSPEIRTDFTQEARRPRLPTVKAESVGSDRDYPILDDHPATTMDVRPSIVSSCAILAGAFVGVGVGLALYFLHVGPEWLKLVGLPGSLFIRALQCLVVPLVFCVTAVVVAQMAAIGRSTILRWQTILPFALTSILAAAQGFGLALAFKSWFQTSAGSYATTSTASASPFNLTMQCANGLYLVATNGSLSCAGSGSDAAALFAATNQTQTTANTSLDVGNLIALLVQLGNILVPVNIFTSFTNGAMLSIVVFAVVLGVAAVSITTTADEPNHILDLLRQFRDLFSRMLHALLFLTPAAVAFLLASSIANFDKHYSEDTVAQLGILFVALSIGMLCHSLIVLPLIVLVATRCNPFPYFQHCIPAYLFAFGSASSLATLPVAIECIERAKIGRSIAHIAMPFGAPHNLNGAALYYPLAMVYLTNLAGLGDEWTPSRYVVLFLAGWIGCAATAPVPGGAITYLVSLWKMCFPEMPTHFSFAALIAADFIFDRMCTVVNLHANIAVTRILADQVDETFEVQAAHHL